MNQSDEEPINLIDVSVASFQIRRPRYNSLSRLFDSCGGKNKIPFFSHCHSLSLSLSVFFSVS